MSGAIRDIKFKISYDTSEVEKGSKAMHEQEAAVRGLSKQFDNANDAATKVNSKIQQGASQNNAVFNALGGHVKNFAKDLNIAGVNVGTTFDALNNGVGGAVKGMNLLKVAFISTGIGAFIVAVGSLVAYFTKTELGSEKLERAMAGLSATMGVIIGKIAAFGKVIVEAFENPKQAIIDLGKFILQNLINRFTALGVILQGIWNRDLKQIANGTAQLASGVTNVVDKYKSLGKEIEGAAKSSIAFTGTLQDIEDAENNLALSVAKTRNQIQLLIIQSKNRALTEKERIDALKQADKLEQGIINDQINLQKQKVAALQKENDLKVANGEVDKGNKTADLREAEIKLENLLGDSIELRSKIQNRVDALQIAGAKNKKKTIEELNKAILDDVNKNAETEEFRNIEKNDKIDISEKDSLELRKQANEGYQKDLSSLEEDALQASIDRYDQEVQLEQEAAEKKKQIRQVLEATVQKLAIEAGNAIFDNNTTLRNNEIQSMEAQKANELKLAGDNKQQQAIINQKYLQEERKIKRQQAEADKEQALFNIAINTAVAAVKAAPNPYLIAEALALGAIEAVVVSSRPLPKYNRGTKSVPGQYKGYDEVLAMVAPEEMIIPTDTKRMYTPALNAIFDRKVPADLINSFVVDQKKFEKIVVVNQTSSDPELKKELKGLRSDIRNKREYQINIDKNGIETLCVSSNNKTKILNNYFTV